MASGLTLYDDAGNPFPISGEMLKKALPTAWVNFDGTSAVGVNCTIFSSHNVSSVEHIGTGLWNIVFSYTLDNTFYTVSGNGANPVVDDSNVYSIKMAASGTYKLTTSVRIRFNYGATSTADVSEVGIVIHGGLN